MKKFFIVVLLLALCAAAFLSKPKDPRASLGDFMAEKFAQKVPYLPAEADTLGGSRYANSFSYSDRILWIDAKDSSGQTVFTNVFSKWVNRAAVKEAARNDLDKAKGKMDNMIDKVDGRK